MKLNNLSASNLSVLQELRTLKAATRKQLAERLIGKRPIKQVSYALNRLESFGFVEKPEGYGLPWLITPAGLALFGESQEIMKSEQMQIISEAEADIPMLSSNKEDESIRGVEQEDSEVDAVEIENGIELMPISPPDFTHEVLHAMEIEVALDQVRSRLRVMPIPARASRIYREILEVLPPALADALKPITLLIESVQA